MNVECGEWIVDQFTDSDSDSDSSTRLDSTRVSVSVSESASAGEDRAECRERLGVPHSTRLMRGANAERSGAERSETHLTYD